ncbi:Quinone oxidoreductase-like protein 2 [Coccomyxa sp. Obi]|nr:Quinone oxidoreductase-like protein 2 [Coccomyxa sp. Obi]
MRALVCKKLGDPLTIEADQSPLELVHDRPIPSVREREVKIQVVAASLNFADALQVQGQYQDKPPLPFIPGSEVSGLVAEVGSKVRSIKKGDHVCAVTRGGAFAEEVVVPEGAVLKLPVGVDLVTAAGLPVAFGTSHVALKERANLQPGQTVLVLGAAGGVGIAAVQICKAMGAKVVAVCRGSSKAEALRRLGADAVIDTSQQPDTPLRNLIKKEAPKGIDVIYDPVGGTSFQEALKVAKWGAQILIIGFASGSIPKVAANIALVKNLTLHGVFWGSYMQHNPIVLQKSLQELVSWWAEKKISIPVSHRFPLEEYREAFKTLMHREAVGKVLILLGSGASRM